MRQKDTYYIRLADSESDNICGLGEAGLFRGLSCDDRPDYEQKLAEVCENIDRYAARPSLLADWPSIRGSGQACRILECAVTEEALHILEENGILSAVMEYAAERICFYMEKRAGGRLKADCILYSNEFGELAKSKVAEEWFILLGQEQGRPI